MEDMLKEVVCLLSGDSKTTLFTTTGEVIEILIDGPYDTIKIEEYLTPILNGKGSVKIDLNEYLTIANSVFDTEELAEEGIVMTHVINGVRVQGIFYPQKIKVEVTVKVDDEEVVIPNVDNLTAHMKRATDDKSPSVINFFKRLASVIKIRKHSGEDLMSFIKKSEMPLTNTGRIIAYKKVNVRRDSEGNEYYVDVHSGKIDQRVGSRVTMPVDMVDPSRHNSCSTGLHVANLGYMRNFGGSTTLIVLVDPENFIAVPHGEDTKARVCSYDVIGVMPTDDHNTVSQGNYVTNSITLSDLIISAVEGTTIRPYEEVFVGEKCVDRIVSLVPSTDKPKEVEPMESTTSGKSLNEDDKDEVMTVEKKKVIKKSRKEKLNDVVIPDKVRDAFNLIIIGDSKAYIAKHLETSTRSIGRWMDRYDYVAYKKSHALANRPKKSIPSPEPVKVAEEPPKFIRDTAKPKKNGKPSVIDNCRDLFNNKAFDSLKAIKKKKKKSWKSLGFTDKEAEILNKK